MRKSNEQSLKEVLDLLLKAYKLDKGIDQLKIAKAWESSMGKIVNKHTTDLYVRDKVLYVCLDSSIVRQELSYAKASILETLNKEAGTDLLTDIVLR